MDYYKIFKETKGNRDPIFQEVLNNFIKKPISILEIGSLRDLQNGRAGDGWSTFHFAEYVKNYGGEITVCDIDKGALDSCKMAIDPFYNQINFHHGDGLTYLKSFSNKRYDLIHLDGSDNPNDMLAEYENAKASLILCDDFSTKGILLRQKYPRFRLYRWPGYGHEVALYGLDDKIVELQSIL